MTSTPARDDDACNTDPVTDALCARASRSIRSLDSAQTSVTARLSAAPSSTASLAFSVRGRAVGEREERCDLCSVRLVRGERCALRLLRVGESEERCGLRASSSFSNEMRLSFPRVGDELALFRAIARKNASRLSVEFALKTFILPSQRRGNTISTTRHHMVTH